MRYFTWWSVVCLFCVFLAGLVVPLLYPRDPRTPYPGSKLEPPSAKYWFGTDVYGMDVFSRTFYAIRVDLILAIIAVLFAICIGLPLGALSGIIGGIFDEVIMRICDILQAFPPVFLAMTFLITLGNNLSNLLIVMALLNIPVYAKMVRSVAMSLKTAEFVQAAYAAGHSRLTAAMKHVVPNVLTPVFAQFPLSCAYAVQMIAGFGFLGLGIKPPEPEWGSMINQNATYIISGCWWPTIFPGIMIILFSFLLNDIANKLHKLTT